MNKSKKSGGFIHLQKESGYKSIYKEVPPEGLLVEVCGPAEQFNSQWASALARRKGTMWFQHGGKKLVGLQIEYWRYTDFNPDPPILKRKK